MRDFFTEAFVDRDYRAASASLLPDFIQHSPEVGAGVSGFLEGVGAYIDPRPDLVTTIHRVFSEGDLVFIHAEQADAPGAAATASMDIFRVADGKIAEHWDAQQEVPATTANGHTMFDGPTVPAAIPAADGEVNRAAALDFLDLAFNHAKAQEAVDTYVGATYVQHNPNVADGGAAFVDAFAGATPLTGDKKTVFPRSIVDGDVVVQTFAPTGDGMAGSGSIDIFRFDADNKIVEHWDAVQDYPTKTASGNTVWDDGR